MGSELVRQLTQTSTANGGGANRAGNSKNFEQKIAMGIRAELELASELL